MLNENVSAKHLKTYNKVEAATINLVFMGEKILRYIKDHMAGAYVYVLQFLCGKPHSINF